MTRYWRQSPINLCILRTTMQWVLAPLFLSFKDERYSKQSSSLYAVLQQQEEISKQLSPLHSIPTARKRVHFNSIMLKKHFQVRRRYLHRVLHFHNWGRFQNQNYRAGRKDHQTTGNHWKVLHFLDLNWFSSDLGHCRSREVQDNHFFLLQVRKEEPACRLSLLTTCLLSLLTRLSEGHMASSWSTMSQTKNPLTMWNSGFRCLRRCAFDACLRIPLQLSWRKRNHVMLIS